MLLQTQSSKAVLKLHENNLKSALSKFITKVNSVETVYFLQWSHHGHYESLWSILRVYHLCFCHSVLLKICPSVKSIGWVDALLVTCSSISYTECMFCQWSQCFLQNQNQMYVHSSTSKLDFWYLPKNDIFKYNPGVYYILQKQNIFLIGNCLLFIFITVSLNFLHKSIFFMCVMCQTFSCLAWSCQLRINFPRRAYKSALHGCFACGEIHFPCAVFKHE